MILSLDFIFLPMSEKEYKFEIDPRYHQLVRDQMAGFEKMNEFAEDERRRNLPKMTAEDSLANYADLLAVWERTQQTNPDMGALDKRRVEELIERRRLFAIIAEGLRQKNADGV